MIPAGQLIPLERVRRQLMGVGLVLADLDPAEVDALLTESLLEAESDFYLRTKVALRQVVIKTSPQEGDVYDWTENPFDYYTRSFAESAWFTLRTRPVASIQRMAVEFNNAERLFEFPLSWMRLRSKMGILNVVPDANLAAGYNLAASEPFDYLPFLRGGLRQDLVPLIVSIDYTAGIPDVPTNPQWEGIRGTLARMAALKVRPAILEMVATNSSRDGVSASFPSAERQIALMEDKVETFLTAFENEYRPVAMVIV